MTIPDAQLVLAAEGWNKYASEFLRSIPDVGLLGQKNLLLYLGLGVTTPRELSERLVNDYVASSLENTMGHLYDLVMQRVARKIPNQKKQTSGYIGVDFIQETEDEIRLIDLATSTNTKNASARTKCRGDMERNLAQWQVHEQTRRDDNPLVARNRLVVAIWAVARGRPTETTKGGILRLRGDCLWDYLGAGPKLIDRLGSALASNPLQEEQVRGDTDLAKARLSEFLSSKYAGHGEMTLDWAGLLTRYP